MSVEVVTCCLGYADFLAVTLPQNLPLVDSITVVTDESDRETIDVCRRHSVHYITMDEHTRGGEFNKGRMIQRGFDQIGGHDWIMHLDADIVLPRKFRDFLDWAHLDERCIYGADRSNIVGWQKWQNIVGMGGWDNHLYQNYLKFTQQGLPGARWVSKIHGYVPIGFFQLWHGSQQIHRGLHAKRYQYHHGDAARSDVQFALQWDRRDRVLLPEVIVLHLESETAPNGINWEGRKTKRFGPPPGPSLKGLDPS